MPKTTGFAVVGGGGMTRTGSAQVAFDGKDFVPIPKHRSNEFVRVWFPIRGLGAFVLRVYSTKVSGTIELVLPGDRCFSIGSGEEAEDRYGQDYSIPPIPPAHLINAGIRLAKEIASRYHDRGDYTSENLNQLAYAEEVSNGKSASQA